MDEAERMTAKERVEKLFPIDPLHPWVGTDLRQRVSEALREAEAQGIRKGVASISDSAAYERGWQAAIEASAKVCVEQYGLDYVAGEIIQLKPEGL